MKTIRASEIGAYLYCRRAWWYQRQGVSNANQAELAAGTAMHEKHGQAVFVGGCLRSLAYIFLLTALAVGAIAWLQTLLA